jgi:uncharacterized membrane protein YdbT with pleckstrin-like domain
MSLIKQESERRKTAKPGAMREKIIAGQPNEHIRQLLLDGEQVVRVAEIHPAIYWKGAALGIIALLCAVAFPVAINLWIFLLIVSGIVLAGATITKHFLMLVLTNKRVLIRRGIIQLEVIQMHHRKIESVELAWTILGQFLGYASVVVTGTGSRVAVVPWIANAPQFRKEMESIVMEIEEGKTAGTVPADADDVKPVAG